MNTHVMELNLKHLEGKNTHNKRIGVNESNSLVLLDFSKGSLEL